MKDGPSGNQIDDMSIFYKFINNNIIIFKYHSKVIKFLGKIFFGLDGTINIIGKNLLKIT